MKVTLETIAKNTGFSKSTISRVLNGKADSCRIPQSTVETIIKAAESCGYVPDLIAKKMRKSKSQTIGLLIPSISNPYFADIASVVISDAKSLGYTTIVTDTMEDVNAQNESITAMISRKVDGIITVPCGNDPAFLEQTNKKYVPIVLVDRYYENSCLPYVVTNNSIADFHSLSHFLSFFRLLLLRTEDKEIKNCQHCNQHYNGLSTLGHNISPFSQVKRIQSYPFFYIKSIISKD